VPFEFRYVDSGHMDAHRDIESVVAGVPLPANARMLGLAVLEGGLSTKNLSSDGRWRAIRGAGGSGCSRTDRR
jgi:hypothetical protein